ncbi:hypothetical protein L6452_10303 [Arctium lappa]|uniref:Uncharacterized protein n=1 Tax=Arctium lappa TaxID=4217 RepID=A0ACB9DMZ7_ARCLA|nr:hypothetical protein L6452_10303 [Arctium lappa]
MQKITRSIPELLSFSALRYIVLEEVVRKRAEIFERYDGDIAWQHTEVDVPRKELERIAKAMVEPKEELRRLILDPAMGSNTKLSLIYSVHRLGLTYLFLQKI